MTQAHEAALCAWLEERFCRSMEEIRAHISAEFGREYSHSSCIELLARLGFEYRKPKPLPRVSSAEKQTAFIALYEKLMPELPADDAVSFFTGQGAEENFMLFVSNCQPFPGAQVFTDAVASLEALNVSRTAVGFGGGTNTGFLDIIESTGGSKVFANVSQLTNAFAASPLYPADLLDFSLLVNGVQVADKTDLIDLGGGDYSLDSDLFGLDNDLGDTNTVVAGKQNATRPRTVPARSPRSG